MTKAQRKAEYNRLTELLDELNDAYDEAYENMSNLKKRCVFSLPLNRTIYPEGYRSAKEITEKLRKQIWDTKLEREKLVSCKAWASVVK